MAAELIKTLLNIFKRRINKCLLISSFLVLCKIAFSSVPLIDSAVWKDANSDGNIDQVVLYFNINVDVIDGVIDDSINCISIVDGATPVIIDDGDYAQTGISNLTLPFLNNPITGTDITSLSVTYTQNAIDSIVDNAAVTDAITNGANPATDIDSAAPVLINVAGTAGNLNSGNLQDGSSFTLTFSESVTSSSATFTLNVDRNGATANGSASCSNGAGSFDGATGTIGDATSNNLTLSISGATTSNNTTDFTLSQSQTQGWWTTSPTFAFSAVSGIIDGNSNAINTSASAVTEDGTLSDNTAPTAIIMEGLDSDNDGQLESVTIWFNEAMDNGSIALGDFSTFTINNGSVTPSILGGSPDITWVNDNEFRINIDTEVIGTGIIEFDYNDGGTGISSDLRDVNSVYWSGGAALDETDVTTRDDVVAPVLVDVTGTAGGLNSGNLQNGSVFTLTFSEAVYASSATFNFNIDRDGAGSNDSPSTGYIAGDFDGASATIGDASPSSTLTLTLTGATDDNNTTNFDMVQGQTQGYWTTAPTFSFSAATNIDDGTNNLNTSASAVTEDGTLSDNTAPTAIIMEGLDSDNDGQLESVTIWFNEAMDNGSINLSDFSTFTVSDGSGTPSILGGSPTITWVNDNEFRINIQTEVVGTGVIEFDYNDGGTGISSDLRDVNSVYWSGGAALDETNVITRNDVVAPVPVSALLQDNTAGDGFADQITIIYSENILAVADAATSQDDWTIAAGASEYSSGTLSVTYAAAVGGSPDFIVRFSGADIQNTALTNNLVLTRLAGASDLVQDAAANTYDGTAYDIGSAADSDEDFNVLTDNVAPVILNDLISFYANGTDPEYITMNMSENINVSDGQNIDGFSVNSTPITNQLYNSTNFFIQLDAASDGTWLSVHTVDYSGASGNVADANGNELADFSGHGTSEPAGINSGFISPDKDNAYVLVTFDGDVWSDKNGNSEVTAADFSIDYQANTGNSNISYSLSGVIRKGDDSVIGNKEGVDSVRLYLTKNGTGTPTGAETIEITPASSTAIFDVNKNALPVTTSTGQINLTDNTPPSINKIYSIDTDNDGNVDALEIEFSEPIDDSDFTVDAIADWAVSNTIGFGSFDMINDTSTTVSIISGGTDSDSNDEYFKLIFSPVNVTGTDTIYYRYINDGNDDISDSVIIITNKLADISPAQVSDTAAPVLISGEYQDTDNNGTVETIVFTFSEPLSYTWTASHWSIPSESGSINVGNLTNGDSPSTGGTNTLTINTNEFTTTANVTGGIEPELRIAAAANLSDGKNTQTLLKDITLNDGAAPLYLSSKTLDNDSTGDVDYVMVVFTEPVSDASIENTDFNASIAGGALDDADLTEGAMFSTVPGTGDYTNKSNDDTVFVPISSGNETLQNDKTDYRIYIAVTGNVNDLNGNASTPEASYHQSADGAPPVIKDGLFRFYHQSGEDQIYFDLTETIATFSSTTTYSSSPWFGFSVNTSGMRDQRYETTPKVRLRSHDAYDWDNETTKVTYTPGGIMVDAAGNEMRAFTNKALAEAPIIDTAYMSSNGDNEYITIEFTQACFTNNLQNFNDKLCLTINDFLISTTKNTGGAVENVSITDIRDNNGSILTASGAAAGYSIIRLYLNLDTIPTGAETIEIKAKENEIYNGGKVGMDTSETTGAINLSDQTEPKIVQVISLDEDNDGVLDALEIEFSEPIVDSTFKAAVLADWTVCNISSFEADTLDFISDSSTVVSVIASDNDANDEYFKLYFTADDVVGTGAIYFKYTNDAGPNITDTAGNKLWDTTATLATDGAKPVLLTVDISPYGTGDSVTGVSLNQLIFGYSEPMVISMDGNQTLDNNDIGYNNGAAAEAMVSTDDIGSFDADGSIEQFGNFLTTGNVDQTLNTWNTIRTNSNAKTISIIFNDNYSAYFTNNTPFSGTFDADESSYIFAQSPSSGGNSARLINSASANPTANIIDGGWDLTSPTVEKIWTLDIDTSGEVDAVDIRFSEFMLDSVMKANPGWIEIADRDCDSFSTTAYRENFRAEFSDGLTEDSDENDENVRILIATPANEINGTDLKVVDYAAAGSGFIRDHAGNLLIEADDIGATKIDAARPVATTPISDKDTMKIGDVSTSNFQTDENGDIYMILETNAAALNNSDIASLNAAIAADEAFVARSSAIAGNSYTLTLPAGPKDGTYKIRAVDGSDNLSDTLTGWLTIDNTKPENENVVFSSTKLATPGSMVAIVSSDTASNEIWFAPNNTTTFIEGANMTKATGLATSINAPTAPGYYHLYVIDHVGNRSNPTSATLYVDNAAPTVTVDNITLITGTGPYKTGDVITAEWDNRSTPDGDNNTDIATVYIDFAAFGGGSIPASNTLNKWTASYTIVSGNIDANNLNVEVTANDNAGNSTILTDDDNASLDNKEPTVTAANIVLSGATGSGGTIYIIGDNLTATWSSKYIADYNQDITSVSVNFSAFGGGTSVAATETDSVWEAVYTITSGTIDGTNLNVTITVTDDAGNNTNFADTDDNVTVDNEPAVATASNISLSGATGTGGTYKISDVLRVEWDNSADGNNNTDEIDSVIFNFSAFGGGNDTILTHTNDTFAVEYTIPNGAIDGFNKNISLIIIDDAGNHTNITGTNNVVFDNKAPIVDSITISGGTGTGGAFIIGNVITAKWFNTSGADNNNDIDSVNFDFSEFGGPPTATGSNTANIWTATYTIPAGVIDATGLNVSVTATDNAGNTTTTNDIANVTFDNIAPVINAVNIDISGATGTGGTYIIGDTLHVIWDNSEGNTDITTVGVNFSSLGGGSDSTATLSGTDYIQDFLISASSLDASALNISLTVTDNAGNSTTVTNNDDDISIDRKAPVVTTANITLSGGTGTGGAFINGNTITATWDNTAIGDNNPDIDTVFFNFSEFGGGIDTIVNDPDEIWTGSYLIPEGTNIGSGLNVFVTSVDDAHNSTTTEGTNNASIDNQSPVISTNNIFISGATGKNGAFKIGDVITARWDNTASDGDGNTDLASVTADFSAFGGGTNIATTNINDTLFANYTIVTGSIDNINLNISFTATDNSGNATTVSDDANATLDNIPPVATTENLIIYGATGTDGTFKINDILKARWNNSVSGNNNGDIDSVKFNFSAFGGGTDSIGTDSSDYWKANYTITAGSIDGINKNVTITIYDDAENTTVLTGTNNVVYDNKPPTVDSITISGASGTGSAYIINDIITAKWYNNSGADNNTDIYNVTFDFSEFGGNATVQGSNTANIWTATHTITASDIDSNVNVWITAIDNAGNETTTEDGANGKLDNIAPVVTIGRIDTSGATGLGGVYKIGDTLTITWNNSGTGDNNNDIANVVVDFSNLNGGSDSIATESLGIYSAEFIITAESLDALDKNISITVTDDDGNITTVENTDDDIDIDRKAPVVTGANITLSGATGTGGAFVGGDILTATWNNTVTGNGLDNNENDIDSVYFNFSEFNGGTDSIAIKTSNNWSASYPIPLGGLNASNLNVWVTVKDDAGNSTTIEGENDATVDNSVPTVVAGDITLNGASYLDSIFIIGDTVFTVWDASENPDIETVTVDYTEFGGGSAITATKTDTLWTAEYIIVPGTIEDTDLNVTVSVTDSSGNTMILESTDSVTLDNKRPNITLVKIPNDTMLVGDVVIDTIFVTDDGIDTASFVSGTIAGYSLNNLTRINSTTYTIQHTIINGGTNYGGETDIPVVNLVLKDRAGNQSSAYSAYISQSEDLIDAKIPQITNITIPNEVFKVGDVKTATITVVDDYGDFPSLISGDIGGFDLYGLYRVTATKYTAKFLITDDGNDYAAGDSIPVDSVVLKDDAGNSSLAYYDSLYIAYEIDANIPEIISVSSQNAPGKIGDVDTLTITVADDNGDFPVLTSGTFGGYAIANLQRIDSVTYKATYTITQGGNSYENADSIPVSNLVLTDNSGNASNSFSTYIKNASDAIFQARPTATVLGDNRICADDTTNIRLKFTGRAPFDVTYTTGHATKNITVDTNFKIITVKDTTGVTFNFKVTSLIDSTGNTAISFGDSAIVIVDTLPVIKQFNPPASRYYLSDEFDLYIYSDPDNGIFSGSGITSADGILHPNLADTTNPYFIYYTLTDGNGCSSVDSSLMTINTSPTYIDSLDASYCYYDAPVIIVGNNADDSTGWFEIEGPTGLGLTDSTRNHIVFNPALAGPGTHTITYRVITGEDTLFDERDVYVDSTSLVNISLNVENEYCQYNNATPISATLNHSGGTGYFSFKVNNTVTITKQSFKNATFNPSLLPTNSYDTIKYHYISSYGCHSDTVTAPIHINALPSLSFAIYSNYNVDEDNAIQFTATPSGGKFSGSGTDTNGLFNATLLSPLDTVEISYTYTDPFTQCINTATDTTIIREATGTFDNLDAYYCYDIDSVLITCNPPFKTDTIGIAFTSDKNAVETLTDTTAYFFIHKAGVNHIDWDTIRYTYYIENTAYELKKAVKIDSIGIVDFSNGTNFADSIAYCFEEASKVLKLETNPNRTASSSKLFVDPPTVSGFSYDPETQIIDLDPSAFNAVDLDSTYTITYRYISKGLICQSNKTKKITINSLPEVDFDLDPNYDNQTNLVTLVGSRNGDLGIETYYSITPGISSDGKFSPSSIGIKNNLEIKYTFEDTVKHCENSISHKTNIITSGITFIYDETDSIYCPNQTPSYIYAKWTAANDNTTGKIVHENSTDTTFNDSLYFNPTNYGAGEHIFDFYFKDTLGKGYELTFSVFIDSIGTMDLLGLSDQYCESDDKTYTLLPSVSHKFGGTYLFEKSGGKDAGFNNLIDSVRITPKTLVDTSKYDSITIKFTYTSNYGNVNRCKASHEEKTLIHKLPDLETNIPQLFSLQQDSFILKGKIDGQPSTSGTFKFSVKSSIALIDSLFLPKTYGKTGNNLTITYTDKNYATGCENTITETFNIENATGEIKNGDVNEKDFIYCNYADSVLLIAKDVANNDTLYNTKFSGKSIKNTGKDSAWFYPTKVNAGDHKITYTYYGLDSAEFFIEKTLTVDSIGNLIFSPELKSDYCENDGKQTIQANLNLINDKDFSTGRFSGLTNGLLDKLDGSADFTPANADSIGTIIIKYVYTNTYNCKDSIADTVTIHPRPKADFAFDGKCLEKNIQFTDNSIIPDNDYLKDSIIEWNWLFAGDEDTTKNPIRQFTNASETKIKLIVKTNWCSSIAKDSSIFPVEKADANFTWKFECEGNDSTIFIPKYKENGITYKWQFSSFKTDSNSNDTTKFKFSQPGIYPVKFIYFTKNGCSDTISKDVEIREFYTLNKLNPALFDFENGRNGWQWESNDTSDKWMFGNLQTIGNTKIDSAASGLNAWIKSSYGDRDTSYLTSPCFNFKDMNRPIIHLKLWPRLERKDGIILQYTTDEDEWYTLGEYNDVINWYNSKSVQSFNHFTGNNKAVAWSYEEEETWIKASHMLDDVTGKEKVRFRFTFISDNEGEGHGVALDDIWIGERSRNVLFEHFTNYQNKKSEQSNDIIQSIAANHPLDVIDIQYHVNTPNLDPIYKQNPIDPLIKSGGVSTIPLTYINGNVSYILEENKNNEYTTNIETEAKKQKLLDSKFEITANASVSGNAVSINAKINPLENIKNDSTLSVYLILTEKVASIEDSVYNNVVRKILPNPSGLLIKENWVKNTAKDFTASWQLKNIENIKNLEAVVYIQNIKSKEIYQAVKITSSSIATDIFELSANAGKLGFVMYPNPAKGEYVNMVFSSTLTENHYVTVYSSMGKLVLKQEIPVGTDQYVLQLNGLSGMFNVQLSNSREVVETKKLIILK